MFSGAFYLKKNLLIPTFLLIALFGFAPPVYALVAPASNSGESSGDAAALGGQEEAGAGDEAVSAASLEAQVEAAGSETIAPPFAEESVIVKPLPMNLRAEDVPNDGGRAIQILWDKFPKEDVVAAATSYEVLRKTVPGHDWEKIGEAEAASGKYTDSFTPAKGDRPEHALKDGATYEYKLRVLEDPSRESSVVAAVSTGQWFNSDRTVILLATLIYVALVVFFIQRAKQGRKMYVRPISGISAVEDAVGRATEMGKPVLYVPGIGMIEEIATLAALTILSPIAEKVAEYDTPLIVPNRDPVVYSIAQEVVRQAYVKIGRPDSYNEDNIYFLSGRQFAYAAGVAGIMMRDKPATNFFFGAFYAESLILAETGAATGAIQIAGTDQVTQLPFFIAACDYTLMGEELYAASAYLSDDPVLVGSLKALDFAKIFIFALLGSGFAAAMFQWDGVLNLLKLM